MPLYQRELTDAKGVDGSRSLVSDPVGSSRIMPLPTPKCVVFYNGKEKDDDSYEMRLSDAYENKDTTADEMRSLWLKAY